MPLPLIPIAIGAVGALAAIFGSDDDKPSKPPKVIAFFGQVGAGKTTICQILSQRTFIEEYNATPMINKYSPISIGGQLIQFWDTAGSYDEQNRNVKRELATDDTLVYVLNMKDYMGDKKEELTREIRSYVKGGGNKIIGTHKDKMSWHQKYGAKIANEIRQTFHIECEIWDLTRAKTKAEEVQSELLDFILK